MNFVWLGLVLMAVLPICGHGRLESVGIPKRACKATKKFLAGSVATANPDLCYTKCLDRSDCGWYYIDTKKDVCYLIKKKCQIETNNNAALYYMSDATSMLGTSSSDCKKGSATTLKLKKKSTELSCLRLCQKTRATKKKPACSNFALRESICHLYDDKCVRVSGALQSGTSLYSLRTLAAVASPENQDPLPTVKPTSAPSESPTPKPTLLPSVSPTFMPTSSPSESPTKVPTVAPTEDPTSAPSLEPTKMPSKSPSSAPTLAPSMSPTSEPTKSPTDAPSLAPTLNPTLSPSEAPTGGPTMNPSEGPTENPTSHPSVSPSSAPTENPTSNPSVSPSSAPTENPTSHPSVSPSSAPTENPTSHPSVSPSSAPTENPTSHPSVSPSSAPTENPTSNPSVSPSSAPTGGPTVAPTGGPTMAPTHEPTVAPSEGPSVSPSATPTAGPTMNPTESPSPAPSESPTSNPSFSPSRSPTSNPSVSPSESPTAHPSASPSEAPTSHPSVSPSESPTAHPSASPSKAPSDSPSAAPTSHPSVSPTRDSGDVEGPDVGPITRSPTSAPTKPGCYGSKCCSLNKVYYRKACRSCGSNNLIPCVYSNYDRLGCNLGYTIYPLDAKQPVANEAEDTTSKCVRCGLENLLTCRRVDEGSDAVVEECANDDYDLFPVPDSDESKCCRRHNVFYNGACRSCGGHRQLPCTSQNEDGFGCVKGQTTIWEPGSVQPTTENIHNTNSTCVQCGYENMPSCSFVEDESRLDECSDGYYRFPAEDDIHRCCPVDKVWYNGGCRSCGGSNQLPCTSMHDESFGCVKLETTIWLPGADQPTAEEIATTNHTCVRCGYENRPTCSFVNEEDERVEECVTGFNKFPAEDGTFRCCPGNKVYYDGACRSCGGSGQVPCTHTNYASFGCFKYDTTIWLPGSMQPTPEEIEDTHHVCMSCGTENRPTCSYIENDERMEECNNGFFKFPAGDDTFRCCPADKVYADGACRSCGGSNQLPCVNSNEDGFGCTQGVTTIWPPGSAQPESNELEDSELKCVQCGSQNQPTCSFTNSEDRVEECSDDLVKFPVPQDGFRCCPMDKVYANGACRTCGESSQLPCTSKYYEAFGCVKGETTIWVPGSNQPTVEDIGETEKRCTQCGSENKPTCSFLVDEEERVEECSAGMFKYPAGDDTFRCCPSNKVFVDGACRSCGGSNQIPCVNSNDEGLGCRAGETTIWPPTANRPNAQQVQSTEVKCVNCGSRNEPSCTVIESNERIQTCDEDQFLFPAEEDNVSKCCPADQVFSNGYCRTCGGSNQPPCTNSKEDGFGCAKGETTIWLPGSDQPESSEIDGTELKCVRCGSENEPSCSFLEESTRREVCEEDLVKFPGTDDIGFRCCPTDKVYVNGACRSCGGNNQVPCTSSNEDAFGCIKMVTTIWGPGSQQPSTDGIDDTELKCVTCGSDNQPTCSYIQNEERIEGCSDDNFKFPTEEEDQLRCCASSKVYYKKACRTAGGHNQKPQVNGNFERFGCNSGTTIFPSGTSQPIADEIMSSDAKCVKCGSKNRPDCVERP